MIPNAIINVLKKINEFFGTLNMLSDNAGRAVLNSQVIFQRTLLVITSSQVVNIFFP